MVIPDYAKGEKVMVRITAGTSKKVTSRKRPAHFLAALMLGMVSQVGQILLLRELLMIFRGNELSIGIILATWLVWVGIGSRLGATIVLRSNRPLHLLILSAIGTLLVLPTTIWLIRGLRGFFNVLPGAYLSLLDMTISCFLLMAPACLLLGAQFVLLSRIRRESDGAKDTSSAEKTYIIEATGNMLGGLLFTFLLVRYLNSFQVAVFAGILMLAAALLTGQKPTVAGTKRLQLPLTLLVLFVLTVFTFPFLEKVDQWADQMQWRHFSPGHRLVETYQSKHGTIAVVQREDQYTFFQSGHLLFSTAGPTSPTPELEEQEAVQFAHFALVQHRNPQRILLIGGGLRGVLGEIVKHPVKEIDYLELDEVLTEAARPYISPATKAALADPRVRLIHTDGRLFVRTAAEKYDMILVDAPDPTTAALNRYFTVEFFREAAALLNPDGVFVIGVSSTPDLRGTGVANRNATIYHTLSDVFSYVQPIGARFMFLDSQKF